MKTTINNIKIAQGEVSVVMSDLSADIVRHSCQTAKVLRDRGVNTLVLNCAVSNKRFRAVADTIVHPKSYHGNTNLHIRSVVQGNLVGDRDNIDLITHQRNVMVVIICGWEWTSDCWRRKNKLIFFLRELMEQHDVAVIVYSQAMTNPVAGRYDRGGLGRLAQLAIVIIRLDPSGDPADVLPMPPMMVIDPEDWESAEKCAQLIASQLSSYGGNSEERHEYEEAA
jgi:hypothetical protein